MFIVRIVLAAILAIKTCDAAERVSCYYSSWSYYRKNGGAVTPEDLDPNLCTHINYAFISINEDGSLKVLDQNLDINKKLFTRVTNLKLKNPNLKVLLSVGGGGKDGVKTFASVAADSNKTVKFVESAQSYMTQHGFDGIDIDWEYPAKVDKDNYIALISALHNKFNPRGWLVTTAVPASPNQGFDVRNMNKYLDQINIMAYDMYGPWSDYVGQNSPLYASSIESVYQKTHLNVAVAVKNWKDAGADIAKLNVGFGFYGRAFGLKDPNQHGLHAPFKGPAQPMPYVNSGWSYTYGDEHSNSNLDSSVLVIPNSKGLHKKAVYKICAFTGNWTRVWDDEQKVPYKYKDINWVGYDDPQSMKLKVEYAKSQGLGGIMIWSVDQDDVHGRCGEKFPLLNTVHRALEA